MNLPRERISAAIQAVSSQGQAGLGGLLDGGLSDSGSFKDNLAAVADRLRCGRNRRPIQRSDGGRHHRPARELRRPADGVTLPWILEELKSRRAPARTDAPDELLESLAGIRIGPAAARRGGGRRRGIHRAGSAVRGKRRTEIWPSRREGLALVQMVTPVTPPERLAMLCREAKGFVYAVTMTGTTGKSAEVPPIEVLEYMDRVKRCSNVPVCAGFGIRSARTSGALRAARGRRGGRLGVGRSRWKEARMWGPSCNSLR